MNVQALEFFLFLCHGTFHGLIDGNFLGELCDGSPAARPEHLPGKPRIVHLGIGAEFGRKLEGGHLDRFVDPKREQRLKI